jgi:hypothetical protein
VVRREGYPEEWTETTSRANYRYRAALANGDFAREEVNRLGVLVACVPASNWAEDERDMILRHEFLTTYYLARYMLQAQGAIASYCYATVGGGYYEGESSETSVKTCIARESDVPALRSRSKALERAYADLAGTEAWKRAPKACRNAARKTVSALQTDATYSSKRLDLLASNAGSSEIDALDAQYEQRGDWLATEGKLTSCMFPKGTRPS